MTLSKKAARWIFAALLAVAACMFAGCAGSSTAADSSGDAGAAPAASDAPATLRIAYQANIARAPALVAKEQGLIEKYYQEATGSEVNVEWTIMASGADINTAIASGDIDVGMLGIGPAITGITSGLGYKICANHSGQPYGLVSNDESITGFDDLVGSQHQISLTNIGSIGHILLAKALADNGYDAHALDSNLVVLDNADSVNALQSGNVACNVTFGTFLATERADASLHELPEVAASWPPECSTDVIVASAELYENTALYQAFCDAIAEGKQFIAENPEDAAAIVCEYDGNELSDEIVYLQQGTYLDETKGIFELAQFMAENEFIDNMPESYESLVYDNVKGD